MGRLMSIKKRKKQSDIHQEDIEFLSEEGFEDAVEEADEAADAVETDGLRMLRGKNAVWRARQKGEKIQQKMRKIWQKTEKILKRTSCMWIGVRMESGEKKRKRRRRRRAARKENKGNREKKSLGKSPGSSQEYCRRLLVIYLGFCILYRTFFL